MLRSEALRALRGERFFRWRGGEVSRMEGITDAVLALAMTLLIVSLEVPKDFSTLIESFKQLPAFAACFAVLAFCWFYHYQFHRRFGLENLYTIFLNCALIFLLLFYVYPLKFLFTVLFEMWFFGGSGFDPKDSVQLMVLYSGGYASIFFIFGLMNLHAYKHRAILELNEAECQVVRGTLREHGIHIGIALVSICLALFGGRWGPGLSGLVYFLMGPLQGAHGFWNGSKVGRLARS